MQYKNIKNIIDLARMQGWTCPVCNNIDIIPNDKNFVAFNSVLSHTMICPDCFSEWHPAQKKINHGVIRMPGDVYEPSWGKNNGAIADDMMPCFFGVDEEGE